MSIQSLIARVDTGSLLTNLFVTAATVVVSVLALVYSSKFAGPLPISVSQTSTEKLSTFDVQGESEIVTIPDQAELSLGFNVVQPTVQQAQDQANKVTNGIVSAVKNLGIKEEDIKTTNYSVYPEYDYSEDSDQRITGYRVNSTVRVLVKDLDKTNQVIDAASGQGANQIGGISFTISSEKEDELTKQARKEAIEDAKANAKELAGLAGMSLGKIVNIQENRGGGYPQPVMMRAESMDSAMGGELPKMEPTNVEPGSTTLNYSVTLSYETQ